MLLGWPKVIFALFGKHLRCPSGYIRLTAKHPPLGPSGDTRDPPPCVALRPPPFSEAVAAFFGSADEMTRARIVGLAVAVVAVVVFVAAGGWEFVNDGDRVEDFFTERGALGPAVFVLSMWLLQPAGFPGALFLVPAAVVWPLPTAIALSWLGNMGASTIAFAVARWFARDWARNRLPGRILAWDRRVSDGGAVRVTAQVTAFRVVTGQLAPADWLLGVSTVRLRAFFVGTAVGILPGIVAVTALGGSLLDLLSDRWARWALLAVVVVFAGVRRLRRRRHVPSAR